MTIIAGMMYKQHALSRAFPAMLSEELAALSADIAVHGQREPGILFEGELIDGWHRQRACIMANVDFVAVEYTGTDPVALVMSRNAFRRHLTASQRAAAVVACNQWAPTGKPAKGEPGSPLQKTNAELAVEAKTTERTVQQAKVAAKAGLGDAVRDGKMSAKAAAKLATGKPEKTPEKKAEPVDLEGDLIEEMDATIRARDAEIAALSASDTGAELLAQIRLREHAEKELGVERNKNARLIKERDTLAKWQSQIVNVLRCDSPKVAMAEIVAWRKLR